MEIKRDQLHYEFMIHRIVIIVHMVVHISITSGSNRAMYYS